MAKKQKKPKKSVKPHTLYEISGSEIKRKNKTCPKCGKTVFMAKHGNRSTCGKCGYTEFETKKPEKPKEEKKEKPKPKEEKPKKE
ncbi:30S ribosomal protein S27ae [Candidatus Woesearchaeota archaeon]|nr:30S ribosomal protein S27ae [Candidatus Woesearchaeota archaeon]